MQLAAIPYLGVLTPLPEVQRAAANPNPNPNPNPNSSPTPNPTPNH